MALAFGLSLLVAAYAIGSISGCHINPAVTLGLWVIGKTRTRELPFYIVGQIVGGLIGATVIFVIAKSSSVAFSAKTSGFASNGYGLHSPGGYSLLACLLAEALLTFFFLIVILGATDERAAKGLAPLAIGFCLTLIHLISIPITNTSVNPARSTGPAIIVAAGGDPWAIQQLWLFWVAPLVGGLLAGLFYQAVLAEHLPPPVVEKPVAYSA